MLLCAVIIVPWAGRNGAFWFEQWRLLLHHNKAERRGCQHRKCCSLEHPMPASMRSAGFSHTLFLSTFLLINCTLSLNLNLTQTSSYLLPSGGISWITAKCLCLLAKPAKPWTENLCEKQVAREQWKMFLSRNSLEKLCTYCAKAGKQTKYLCVKTYKF